jgi:hypothetical protein
MERIAAIADAVVHGLRARADLLESEQAVRGLDSLEELGLHPILAGALAEAGFGVFPEERYPHVRHIRAENLGERCDLVLTEGGRALAEPGRDPTLFDPPDAVALEDAFWLEIKLVGQYAEGGPNPRYTSQLLTEAKRDVDKLASSPGIRNAALLIVLFAEDMRVADHDLALWLTRCLDAGLPVGSPAFRSFPIADRLGHRHCALGVFPVGSAAPPRSPGPPPPRAGDWRSAGTPGAAPPPGSPSASSPAGSGWPA